MWESRAAIRPVPQLEWNLCRDREVQTVLAVPSWATAVCTQGTDCSEDEHAGIWPMGLLSLEEWSAVRASSGLIRSLLRRGPAGLEREPNWKGLTAAQTPPMSETWAVCGRRLGVPATRFDVLQGCVTLDLTKLKHAFKRLPCQPVLFMRFIFLPHKFTS